MTSLCKLFLKKVFRKWGCSRKVNCWNRGTVSHSSFWVHTEISAKPHLEWFPLLDIWGKLKNVLPVVAAGKEFTGEIVLRPHLSLSKTCGLVWCHLPVPWRKRALARRADLGRQHRATSPRCVDCSQILEQHPVSPNSRALCLEGLSSSAQSWKHCSLTNKHPRLNSLLVKLRVGIHRPVRSEQL